MLSTDIPENHSPDHRYIGQMNYYAKEVNDKLDNPPIGIILWKDKDEVTAEYALSRLTTQMFAFKYVL